MRSKKILEPSFTPLPRVLELLKSRIPYENTARNSRIPNLEFYKRIPSINLEFLE